MTFSMRRPSSIKRNIIGLLLCVASAAFAQKTTSGSEIEAQKELNEVIASLTEGSVSTIEVLHVPDRLETRAAITPQALEMLYQGKLTVRNARDLAGRNELVEALKSSTPILQSRIPDLRWGIIFYASDERRIGALYFDRGGKKGAIDNRAISFGKEFSGWLKRRLPDSLQ